MNLPPFNLPSAPLTPEIIFRSPTVTDAMEYAEIDLDEKEAVNTRYLNALQVSPLRDSRLWTQQDRRTALLWIYSNSREEAVTTYTYECGHCGNVHHADINMRDVLEELELLAVPCEIRCKIPVSGEPVNWILTPLTGAGAELLERMHSMLPPPDSPDFNAQLTELRLSELALMTRTENDPADEMEAADYRLSLLKKMSLGHEFPALVARIRQMNEDLRHGVKMTVEKDGVRLILPPQACKSPKQEGAQGYTELRAPFRDHELIARIRSEWMGNDDQ